MYGQNILVTGSRRGLGRYLREELNCEGWDRTTPSEAIKKFMSMEWDLVVHCAANSAKVLTQAQLYQFIADNILLTKTVTSIPHKRLVQISTVDVYPQNSTFSEDEAIVPFRGQNPYSFCKLAAEEIVSHESENCLILRCVGLLGPYARPANLVALLENKPLTLTATSVLNYIPYRTILSIVREFLLFPLDRRECCRMNVSSEGNMTVAEIARMTGLKPTYGTHDYSVGTINNSKFRTRFPHLGTVTEQVVREFFDQVHPTTKLEGFH